MAKKVYAVDTDWNIVGGKKSLTGIIEPTKVLFIGTKKECEDWVSANKSAETPAPVEPVVEIKPTIKNEESMVDIFEISSPQSLTHEPAPKRIETVASKAWGAKNKSR